MQSTSRTRDDELDALPNGARVAVVTLMGSLSPITLGHVQCFVAARRLLVDGDPQTPASRFDYCIGFVSLNEDKYLTSKFFGTGETPLFLEDRVELIRLATAELPWLEYSAAHLFDSRTSAETIDGLRARWPSLVFEHFNMNGADDVLKYRKWCDATPSNKFITMLRPGSTDALVQRLQALGWSPHGTANFVVGPELPDVSSSAARRLSRAGDRAGLLQLVHPEVADWMLQRDGHASISCSSAN
jgi:nicotinic acid mononucleotide adenylyltransferase